MKLLSIGQAMQQRRLELGLSQDEVCNGICEVITLSRLENGQQSLSYNRVKALMQRLNMPDNRYYALLNEREEELENARKELSACTARFRYASGAQKKQIWVLAMNQLTQMERLIAKDDDRVTQQYIMSQRVQLGKENQPYSIGESIEMLLRALHMTIPNLDLEKLGGRRYTLYEIQLINQISGIYSKNGEHQKALNLYRQMFEYVKKYCDQLSNYAAHFTLVAHNYARELGVSGYYHESIEIATQGKQVGTKYGYYQFLAGFLYIMGECYYHLGEEHKSKTFCIRAYYLYEVMEDENNLRRIDQALKDWFHLDLESDG